MTHDATPVDADQLVYVVPFLNDPAVHRRLRMLELGGMDRLALVGFRRVDEPIRSIDGHPVTDLGRTEDGRLAKRVLSLAGGLGRLGRWGPDVGDVSAVMARSLESLVLASAFRRRYAGHAPLVYEVLDIHHTLIGDGAGPKAMRRLESLLIRRCDLILTSSPGYVREYFKRFHPDLPPVRIVENKVVASEIDPGLLAELKSSRGAAAPPPQPPWVIGWFGQLRCRRSLELLAHLCRRMPGDVLVEIRGRPTAELLPHVEAVAAKTPGMEFHGPYDRARELAAIHSRVHFAWTLDFSESGGNGDWALANRLYESGLFGCVPLAFAPIEAGRWTAARNVGVRFDEPVDEALESWFSALTPELFERYRDAVLRVPLGDFLDDDAEAAHLVDEIRSLTSGRSPRRTARRG